MQGTGRPGIGGSQNPGSRDAGGRGRGPGGRDSGRGGRGGGPGGGQRGRRGGRRKDRRDEGGEDEGPRFEERTVQINRCATTVKGGRRMSFSALVVMGDKKGQVGIGFGKAKAVPNAIEKAQKDARRKMTRVSLQGSTIPHEIVGRVGAAKVTLIPASPGTGVIAGAAVRAVLECAGVGDILTKSFGSPNPINVAKATLNGLQRLRTREDVEKMRGVSLG